MAATGAREYKFSSPPARAGRINHSVGAPFFFLFTSAERRMDPSPPESGVLTAGDVPEAVVLPRPLESLHSAPIPPFLTKTYDLVEDRSLDSVISWSSGGKSFVVWDPVEFSRSVLPWHFKHGNFSSFIRQLNTYGFHKIDTERWEFAIEGFSQGQRHLLRNIRRRRSSQAQQPGHSGACAELAKTDMEAEVERLRRDKDFLMQEVRRLSQQQQLTNSHMSELKQRLQAIEERQKQMLKFLAKALMNPNLLTHLFLQQKDGKLLNQRRNRLRITQQTNKTSPGPFMEGQVAKYKLDDSSSSLGLSESQLNAGTQSFSNSVSSDMASKGGFCPDGETGQYNVTSDSNPLIKEEECEDLRSFAALPTLESDIAALKGKSVINNDVDRSANETAYFVSTPEHVLMETICSIVIQDSNNIAFKQDEVLDVSVVPGDGRAGFDDILWVNFLEPDSNNAAFKQDEMLDVSVISVEGLASSDDILWVDVQTEEQDIAAESSQLWGMQMQQPLDIAPVDRWPRDLYGLENQLPVDNRDQHGGADH